MLYSVQQPLGIIPKISPQLLPENAAQTAHDVDLASGAWEPIDGLTDTGVTVDAATKSLFLYNTTNNHWFRFTVPTDCVRSALASDAYDRVYMSDGVQAKMTANDAYSVGGGSDYPITTYDLGVPAPTEPSYGVSGVPTSIDPLESETRLYVVTYVTAYDEEGPPCLIADPVATAVTWYPGQQVDLTNLPDGPVGGNHKIDRKRIYRTNTGSSGTNYQLVVTLPLGDPTYSDTTESTELGMLCPSVYWAAPQADIKGFTVHPAGFLVGFEGRNLWMSEPYLPHAWPASNLVSFDSEIMAVGVFGTTILVTTKDRPYTVTGNDPISMSKVRLEVTGSACVDKRGLVDMGEYVLYPCAEGLIGAGVGFPPENLTKDILTREQWAEYIDSTNVFVAAQWGSRYVCFSDAPNGSFVFDPHNRVFTTISDLAEAVHYEPTDGKLYIKLDTETAIKIWADADPTLVFKWKSKLVRTPYLANFGAAQVYADRYPVHFRTYVDGQLNYIHRVEDSDVFRLPGGFVSSRWEFEIESAHTVTQLLVGETIQDMKRA